MGLVRVYSPVSGAVVQSLDGPGSGAWFGWSASPAGDVDQDGRADYVVGSPFSTNGTIANGSATVYSGATGTELFELVGETSQGEFGFAVTDAGDVNGDGVPDVAVGADVAPVTGLGAAGKVRVASGRTELLTASDHLVSVASGGLVEFYPAAGPEQGGKLFFLLGSASGTKPGVPVPGGATLPLNFDAYTTFTLTSPDTAPLDQTLAFLDSEGDGFSTFTLGVDSPPEFAGIVLHHAFVVLGASSVDAVSNAVPIVLVP